MMQIKSIIYKGSLLSLLLLLVSSINTFACEACNVNQPQILRTIGHGGVGPQSNWDYFVVISMLLITVYTLYATIRCFGTPKEKKYNQIKNHVLTQQ